MKYAKMPEEALVMNEYDYSSDISSAGESDVDDDGDDSEEEREKRLKELQEQVGICIRNILFTKDDSMYIR